MHEEVLFIVFIGLGHVGPSFGKLKKLLIACSFDLLISRWKMLGLNGWKFRSYPEV
jgi:hypothetical protein